MINLDWETYSEAGYVRVDGKWKPQVKGKPGIKAVGTYVYATHQSTDILCAQFRIDDDEVELWFPGMPNPTRLFERVRSGDLISAFHSFFEYLIWMHVAVRRYGWPSVELESFICTAARARMVGLPRKLGDIPHAIELPFSKDKIGEKLIQKFSIPH